MRKNVICINLVSCLMVFFTLSLCSCSGKSFENKELKLGVITPLSGQYATYGTATKRGIELAVEKINEKGGIRGKRLSIIYEDSQGEPRRALTALVKLTEAHKVPAIIGAFRSVETLAIAPEAERRKVVLFSTSSTADDIRNAGDYVFRNVPTNQTQGVTASHFIVEHLGFKDAAIFYQNDDYGKSLAEAFEKEFEKLGGRVKLIDSFEGGQADFRQALAKIRSAAPSVVFFPGNYQECGKILQQAREIGLRASFVGGDGLYSPNLIRIASSASEGVYLTLMAMGFGISEKEIERFVKTFRDKYSEEPDVYAAYAYDGLKIIVSAIKQGGYEADGIKEALYKTKYKGVTGVTTFDSFGEVSKSYYLYRIKNGSFVRVDWSPSS